jgi:hypothetical protein
MCKWGNTKQLLINGKTREIDSCIFDLVKMFNDNGLTTIACCCGHGKTPPIISLVDGRQFLIFDFETAMKICKEFAPINEK